MDKYQKEGYPKHNGLVASGILFRNHHDKDVIKVMEDWYSEVVYYSFRDQLSFNYVCWKNNFVYDESDIFYFKNEYFQRLEHSSIVKINPIYTQKQVDNIVEAITQTTTIIIPIYNAYDQLRECIESVKKYENYDKTDIQEKIDLFNNKTNLNIAINDIIKRFE